jgi:hypothetical protein
MADMFAIMIEDEKFDGHIEVVILHLVGLSILQFLTAQFYF